MKWIIIVALLFLQNKVNAQQKVIEQDKLSRLFVELLKNLGARKSAMGYVAYPSFSKSNLAYIKGFVAEWGFK